MSRKKSIKKSIFKPQKNRLAPSALAFITHLTCNITHFPNISSIYMLPPRGHQVFYLSVDPLHIIIEKINHLLRMK